MARPRKYIIIDGATIDGISRHRSGRFYILNPEKGTRRDFEAWKDARAAHIANRLAGLSARERAKLAAAAQIRYAAVEE